MKYKISLSVGEMPSHSHSGSISTAGNHNHSAALANDDGTNNSNFSSAFNVGSGRAYVDNNGTHSHTINISNTGSNKPHNNLQPYVSVYIWKRIV